MHSGKAEVRVEVTLAVRGIPQMFLQSATLVSCLHMPEPQQLWDSCRTAQDSRTRTQILLPAHLWSRQKMCSQV